MNPRAEDLYFTGQEVWRLGSIEGGEDAFGEIQSVDVAADGSLLISDSQAAQLSLFDAEQQFVRTIGERGNGPGEFNQLLRGGFADSLVYAVSAGATGYWMSQFDLDGTLVQAVPLRVEGLGTVLPFWTNQGWLATARTFIPPTSTAAGTILESEVRVVRLSPAGAVEDTLLTFAGNTMELLESGEAIAGRIFQPAPFVTIATDGSLVTGDGDRYRFRVVDPDGSTRMEVQRDVPRIPVTESLRQGIAEAVRGWHRELNQSAEMAERAITRVAPKSDTVPSVRDVMAARGDGFWARRADVGDPIAIAMARTFPSEEEPETQYDYFDAEGRYVASFRPPPGFTPMVWYADAVVGVALDDLGVNYVVRLELDAPE